MRAIIGILVTLLVFSAIFVMGIFFWFYTLKSAVYGYKFYLLMNFLNRDRAIQDAEDMLGVPLRDDPEEGHRQYLNAHPEVVAYYKIVAVWFCFGSSIVICNVLYAIALGKIKVF